MRLTQAILPKHQTDHRHGLRQAMDVVVSSFVVKKTDANEGPRQRGSSSLLLAVKTGRPVLPAFITSEAEDSVASGS